MCTRRATLVRVVAKEEFVCIVFVPTILEAHVRNAILARGVFCCCLPGVLPYRRTLTEEGFELAGTFYSGAALGARNFPRIANHRRDISLVVFPGFFRRYEKDLLRKDPVIPGYGLLAPERRGASRKVYGEDGASDAQESHARLVFVGSLVCHGSSYPPPITDAYSFHSTCQRRTLWILHGYLSSCDSKQLLA